MTRDAVGTRKVRGLRKKDLIPGIIYGHGQPNVPVSLSAHELGLAVRHGERLLELEIEGQTQNVLVKAVQYDAFQQEILHVDLARVGLDEMVTVTVPLLLRGTPAGAVEGGVLHQQAAEISVECRVRDIPEDVRVSVAEMKIGDMMHMRDIKLGEGLTLQGDPDQIVCAVTVVAEELAAPVVVEEGAAEPEVIGEKAREEEGAEDAEAEEKKKK